MVTTEPPEENQDEKRTHAPVWGGRSGDFCSGLCIVCRWQPYQNAELVLGYRNRIGFIRHVAICELGSANSLASSIKAEKPGAEVTVLEVVGLPDTSEAGDLSSFAGHATPNGLSTFRGEICLIWSTFC
jgi:hypothetical protein